jgi:hypothetical protein
MAATTLLLSQRPGLRDLGRWVHMLGFRGHFVTNPAATPPPSASYAPPVPPTAHTT